MRWLLLTAAAIGFCLLTLVLWDVSASGIGWPRFIGGTAAAWAWMHFTREATP